MIKMEGKWRNLVDMRRLFKKKYRWFYGNNHHLLGLVSFDFLGSTFELFDYKSTLASLTFTSGNIFFDRDSSPVQTFGYETKVAFPCLALFALCNQHGQFTAKTKLHDVANIANVRPNFGQYSKADVWFNS